MPNSDEEKSKNDELDKLKEKILQLENIIDLMPEHVYWVDRDNVYQGCNKLQAEDLGLASPQEIIGKTTSEFVNETEAKSIDSANLRVMESGQPETIEENIHIGGIKKYFLSRKVPLYNPQGELIGLLGISFDITERRRLEEELQSAREKIEAANQINSLIAVMPGHVYWLDRHHIYQGCNELQARTLGLFSREAILGKTNADFFEKDIVDRLKKINQAVMESGEAFIIEEPYHEKTYLSQKIPLRDQNGVIFGMLGVSFDITERKNMEEQIRDAREKIEIESRTKTEFIRNMEHDIRTPLCGVVSVLTYLNSKEKDPEKKEFLYDAKIAASELLAYLDKIVDFARINRGLAPLVQKKISIKKLVQSIVDLELAAVRDKKIALMTCYAKNLPDEVICDDFRLHRILLNLVSNAIKFTEQGSVNINVKLTTDENIKTGLEISVEDTGIGIAKNQQEKIFEKFVFQNTANKSLYKGTGLGLWVVKQLIDELNGTITLTSEPGKGSCFICKLPITITLVTDDNKQHSGVE